MYIMRHTYVRLYIHTYGNIRTYDCTYSCMFISLQHIHTYVCTYTCNFISICTYVRLFSRIYVHISRYICTYPALTPCSSMYVRSHTPIVVGYLSIAKIFGYDMLHPTFPEHMLCILHTIVIVLAR